MSEVLLDSAVATDPRSVQKSWDQNVIKEFYLVNSLVLCMRCKAYMLCVEGSPGSWR